ncbi:MAG: MASE3 domain-containing protein, partial [Thermodesulfobacteriota bacterium]
MGWLGKKYIAFVGSALVVLAGLLLLNWYDYLLFHTVAELFSIVVAGCVFIISWNSKEFQDTSAFTLLGIAFLCFGLLDGVHTLAYKGMPFFPGYDANLPTQLWIAARYMEATSLFAFSMLLGRTFNVRRVFCGYLVATGVLLALIFGRWFPDCFIPGQ